MHKNKIKQNIENLRTLMKKKGIDSYIVPHNDEYLSEYVPENKERLKWAVGFSGSAGTLLITLTELYLFTDGRYILQAKKETKSLGCKIRNINEENLSGFICNNQTKNKIIGIDSMTISVKEFDHLTKNISKTNIKIKILNNNLIDILWKREPDTKDKKKIFFLPTKYTGLSNKKKLNQIYSYLDKEKVDFLFTQDCESIAWLNNLRGNDLPHTPLVFCCSLISKKDQKIFFENSNIPKNLKKKFEKNTEIYPVNKFRQVLMKSCNKKSKIIVDKNKLSLFKFNYLKKFTKNLINKNDILLSLRSIKNITEIRCTKKAHIIDGVAVCKFLYWYKNHNGILTELDVVKKINTLRSKDKSFICTSFPTIAGAGENGAIIHYQPSEITNRKIKKSDILLLDSGGQYFYGTTDITRTISRQKKISKRIIDDYTTVLKSHIGVNLRKFPTGISGAFLDMIARKEMWDIGEDFAHSTGHGVGFCLNVHEGPFSISLKNTHPIYSNMIFSNEPGIYKNGKYGIRIENLVYTKEIKLNKKKFLILDMLTQAPYERDLIDKTRLNIEEKKWLNNYHKSVIKNITPYLNKLEKIWLENQCKEI